MKSVSSEQQWRLNFALVSLIGYLQMLVPNLTTYLAHTAAGLIFTPKQLFVCLTFAARGTLPSRRALANEPVQLIDASAFIKTRVAGALVIVCK